MIRIISIITMIIISGKWIDTLSDAIAKRSIHRTNPGRYEDNILQALGPLMAIETLNKSEREHGDFLVPTLMWSRRGEPRNRCYRRETADQIQGAVGPGIVEHHG